jgi:hypothetical protein
MQVGRQQAIATPWDHCAAQTAEFLHPLYLSNRLTGPIAQRRSGATGNAVANFAQLLRKRDL